MSYCLYNAQGDIVCKEPFVRSGTREDIYETFGNINVRPNEQNQQSFNVPPDVLKTALQRGCSVLVDKNRGFSISDCKLQQPSDI